MNEVREKVPHYTNDPVINELTAPQNRLYRPNINHRLAMAWVMGAISASGILSLIAVEFFVQPDDLDLKLQWFINLFIYCSLFISILLSRFILIWFIRLYQRYALPETRLKCCYQPSCSEYAILALYKYGIILGGIKSIDRIIRCGPPGGIDYP